MNKQLLRFTIIASLCSSMSIGIVHASVIGYWRLGDGSSFTADSSGNGLTLTNSGVTQETIPATGATSDFSNPIPQTQAQNDQAGNFGTTAENKWLSIVTSDILNVSTAFTIEAMINPSSSSGSRYIASKWNAANPTPRSWALGIINGGLSLLLFDDDTANSDNSARTTRVDSGWTFSAGTDYYVAAVFEEDTVIFYRQNLSAGTILESASFNIDSISLNQSNARFVIGGQASGVDAIIGAYGGHIDEVRYSGAALNENQLLISIPEPSAALLPAAFLIGLVSFRLYTRRCKKS